MTILVTENFSSAPAFTQVGGALSVSGGRLRPSATNTDCGGYSNTSMGTANHWAQVSLITTADTSDVYHSLYVRWDGVDPNSGGDCYVFQQNFSDLTFYSANSSSFNTLYNGVGVLATPGTYVLYVECNGNQISAKLNGTHVSGSPFTDTGVTTGSLVGLNMYSGTTVADSEFDDFSAGNLLSPLSVIGRYTPGTTASYNLRR